MKTESVSSNRWKSAQKFEKEEWLRSKEIVDLEWKELVEKFTTIFKKIRKTAGIKSSDSILDIGCGPTVPARLFGAGKITGIEPLAKKLKIKVPGVTIVQGKGESMPFNDSSFSFALCRNAIDHTNDPIKVIEETHRVLKSGGQFLLICYTYAPFITWIKNFSEKHHFMNNVGHPYTYTPESLEDLVRGKFKIIKRYTFHTGQNSTDYGKTGIEIEDTSVINKALIWINKYIFGSKWFLKEYGFLAIKK